MSLALCVLPAGSAPAEPLVDQHRHPVSPAELSGRWLLVYFGYSRCPDICPAALTVMAAVLRRLGPDGDRLTPIFVSLDPAYDTPDVLAHYAAHFTPRLRALTGPPAAIADAARAFGVPWEATGTGTEHGVFLYLVRPDGSIAEHFHPQNSVPAVTDRIQARISGAQP